MDIDHFKKINDSRGHGTGDHLLQTVAQRLRAAVGKQDLVTRMSGDEFVIVVVSLRDAGAAEAIAERIQSAVQAPIAIGEAVLNVSASMGIALFPNHGLDMESLLKHADIALYQAKEAGRRCHRMFSQDMLVRVSESVALEQALRRAVGTDQLSMVYQPIIDLRSGRIASLEALMRWRHPDPMGRIFEVRKHAMFARWNRMAKQFARIAKDINMAVKAGGADPASPIRRCGA
jgi:diguanylate cyclase (GGDEF)-like protein